MGSSIGNSNPIMDERRHRWARERLDIPFGGDLEASRTSFLAKLEKHNFMPDESVGEAWRVVLAGESNSSTNDPRSFLSSETKRLCERIDGFARTMFQLPPQQRRQEFDTLESVCQWNQEACVRLNRLRPGLAVSLDEIRSEADEVQRLTRFMCETFVVTGSEQVRQRSRFMSQISNSANPAAWKSAAEKLDRHFKEISRLDRRLIAWLTPSSTSSPHPRAIQNPFSKQTAIPAGGNGKRNEAQPSQTAPKWWLVFVIITFLSTIIRSSATRDANNYNPPSRSSRQYSRPNTGPSFPGGGPDNNRGNAPVMPKPYQRPSEERQPSGGERESAPMFPVGGK